MIILRPVKVSAITDGKEHEYGEKDDSQEGDEGGLDEAGPFGGAGEWR